MNHLVKRWYKDLGIMVIISIYSSLKIKFKMTGKASYQQADRLSRGALTILLKTIENFNEAHAGEAAASIAYYALLSLFPLLIFLIGFVSSVLENKPVQLLVLNFVEEALPTSQQLTLFVKQNIQQVLAVRDTIEVAGTIGLLWSATAVFSILAHNINRAWHTARKRNFFFKRLIALAMVASLTALLILWVLATTIFNLLPWFEVPILGGVVIYNTYAWSLISQLVPWFVIFITFLSLYRWVPNTKVRWIEAILGAGVASVGWELVGNAFGWYLTSGLAQYQLIYGSLGALVALMLWIYLNSMLVLFGAHLSATTAMQTRLKEEAQAR
jgi:membrane protein